MIEFEIIFDLTARLDAEIKYTYRWRPSIIIFSLHMPSEAMGEIGATPLPLKRRHIEKSS